MNKNKMLKSSFRIMRRFKLRTFFMMLGVIIGIGALTLVLSMGKGTQEKLMKKIEKVISASNILITAGGGEMRSGSNSGGPTTTLTLADLEALKEQVPNIEDYDPVQMAIGRSVKYKDKNIDLRIMGSAPQAEELWNRSVTSGRFFDRGHMKQSARVALVGTSVVELLFGGMDPVGEQIRIGTTPFKVIGVLEPMGVDPHGLDRDMEIVAPITTVMRRVMNVDYISSAKLLLADKSLMEETAAEITGILRERHHIAEGEYNDFTVITPAVVKEIAAEMTNVFSMLLPLIAGIALLAGGVVVAALMLIMVNERKAEIGLRKALGARAGDILRQFILETAIITVTGGVIGFLLGTAGVQLVAAKMNLPPIVPWEAFLLGLTFSALMGIAAGILPARSAAALEPVETLK